MARTRYAGNRGRSRKKSSRRSRRGLVGNVARLGADSFDDISRASGNIVGNVPIVGSLGEKMFDFTGKTGSDLLDLAGTTGDRASGLLTSPFKRLLGKTRRKRRKHRKHHKRSSKHNKRSQKRRRKRMTKRKKRRRRRRRR